MSPIIPLIDLNTPNVQEVAQAIGDAIKTVGFLHVKNLHPKINQTSVDRMFAISGQLFSSPRDELQKCRSNGRNGWVPFQANRLDEIKSAASGGDLKQNFAYGRYSAPATKTEQPLPPALLQVQDEVDEFHNACYEGSSKLFDAFSVALGLPVDYFRKCHDAGFCALTFISYPQVAPGQAPDGPDVARASAHKDWGSLTLLFQEQRGTPGLEIFHKGEWHPAPIIPNTVLVNVGLALELWTGNQFVATLHRVLTFPEPDGGYKARKSIAYFVQPKDDVILNTINEDGSITETEGALTSGQFWEQRMGASTIAAA